MKRDKYLQDHPDADPDKVLIKMKERPYLQEDILEGTIGTSSNIRGINQDFRKNLLADPLFRSIGMGYCNILCFSKLYYRSVPPLRYPEYHLNNDMNDLGQYVAIIRDQDEFVNRIKIAVEKQGFSFLCGSVNYHPLYHNGKISEAAHRHHAVVKAELEDGKSYDLKSSPFKGKLTTKYDCFDKTDKYARQNEWRVALYRGVKDTGAYRLEIGDIRDIVSYSVISSIPTGDAIIVGRDGSAV